MRKSLLMIGVLFLSMTVNTLAAIQGGVLSGQVTTYSNAPIAGAVITGVSVSPYTGYSFSGTTDASGNYSINSIYFTTGYDPGQGPISYQLHISAVGYQDYVGPVFSFAPTTLYNAPPPLVQNVQLLPASAQGINNCNDLQNIQSNLNGYYVLNNDINCSGLNFIPIGSLTQSSFQGVLEGNNHSITNLSINGAGLFYSIASPGIIKDLNIKISSVNGTSSDANVGLLSGTVNGGTPFSNVSVQGIVTGGVNATIGGLVGTNNGADITQTSANVFVTGNVAGGLVGLNNGTIEQSFSLGTVTGTAAMGGLVGTNNDTIKNSYSQADVILPDNGIYAGGLVGISNIGLILASYASGEVLVSHPAAHSSVTWGGLGGYLSVGPAGTGLTYNYWDTQTTKQKYISGNLTTTGETTIQMYNQAIYNGSYWDFTNIWGIYAGADYPYLKWVATPTGIQNCQDLQNMNNNVNGSYVLLNDIDCKAIMNFQPIGRDFYNPITQLTSPNPFTGTFNGLGHYIHNLYSDATTLPGSQSMAGLFGKVSNGQISKLHIDSATVNSLNLAGILASQFDNESSAIGVTVQGMAVGAEAGGLVGVVSSGTIKRCSANVNLTGDTVGGLVGTNSGLIQESFSKGIINGHNNPGELVGPNLWSVGGLVGINLNTIQDSYSQTSINLIPGNTNHNAGGLVGWDTGSVAKIINTYASGKVSALNNPQATGGLVAVIDSGLTLTNSYWDNQTTQQLHSAGSLDTNGKTTAQMQNQTTFVNWDFVNTWMIFPVSQLNDGYPHLLWEPFTLNINEIGDGQGTIVSSPAGINCTNTTVSSGVPNQCQAQFSAGTVVTLTAKASPGSKLQWPVSSCSGSNTCTITISNNLSFNVAFNLIANANVHGLIIDSVSKRPILAAGTVRLVGLNRSELDRIINGAVNFYLLKSGNYVLTFNVSGYPLQTQTMVIAPSDQGKTKAITFQLHKH